MTPTTISRRTLLRGLATGLAALPVLHVGAASAQDAALSTDDPTAKALGYVTDASAIAEGSEAAYKPGSTCAGCALYQAAQEKDGHAPCAAFPGKVVAAAGWCRAFAAKPA